MRALVTRLREDRTREKVLVDDWPEPPAPTGNQVRTRTLCTGVTNGTERNDLLAGNYATSDAALPSPLGYQNVGEVTDVGPDVARLKVGDVLFSGVRLVSDHLEYVVVPEDELLVPLPDSVDRRHAALLGMASVAMHVCRSVDVRDGERVLIVGLGCVGQIAAQIAHSLGADVDACDVHPGRLQTAEAIGCARAVFDTSGPGWAGHIGDGAYDTVVDLAGVPGMENRLIAAARPRGQVALIAGRDEVRYDFNLGQSRQIALRQTSHFGVADLTRACRALERGTIRVAPLLRDVVPVREAGRIYDTLRDDPGRLMGTVFEW